MLIGKGVSSDTFPAQNTDARSGKKGSSHASVGGYGTSEDDKSSFTSARGLPLPLSQRLPKNRTRGIP